MLSVEPRLFVDVALGAVILALALLVRRTRMRASAPTGCAR